MVDWFTSFAAFNFHSIKLFSINLEYWLKIIVCTTKQKHKFI